MRQYPRYRAKLHRLLLLHEAIQSGNRPSSQALGRELEVSSRTVRRDIEFMRDVLGAPLAYDPSRKGYFYTEPSWSLPNIRITEGDLLGLALAQMALHAYKGTPLAERIGRITEKLQAALPNEIDVRPADVAGIFRFSLGPVTSFDPEHWDALADAARKRHTVRIEYHALYKDEVSQRDVDPYLLRCYRGDWYLIGNDHRTGYVAMFNIARITALRTTRRTFAVRDDFEPDEYLGGTFQVTHRAERHTVRIQFSGAAARLVAEKQWHSTQKITRKRDGSIILRMTVADLHEIAAWTLSFGPQALVLAPAELRKQVADAAARTAAQYSTGPSRTRDHKKGNGNG